MHPVVSAPATFGPLVSPAIMSESRSLGLYKSRTQKRYRISVFFSKKHTWSKIFTKKFKELSNFISFSVIAACFITWSEICPLRCPSSRSATQRVGLENKPAWVHLAGCLVQHRGRGVVTVHQLLWIKYGVIQISASYLKLLGRLLIKVNICFRFSNVYVYGALSESSFGSYWVSWLLNRKELWKVLSMLSSIKVFYLKFLQVWALEHWDNKLYPLFFVTSWGL